MEEASYSLHMAAPGGSGLRDVTQLVQSITWSGSLRQTARQLSVRLAIPRDGSVEPPELEEGAALSQEFEHIIGQALKAARVIDQIECCEQP